MPDAVAMLWEWMKGAEGRTQAELARVAGSSPQSVWRWLHRKTTPTYAAMRRLESALGIPVSAWPIGVPEESPADTDATDRDPATDPAAE